MTLSADSCPQIPASCYGRYSSKQRLSVYPAVFFVSGNSLRGYPSVPLLKTIRIITARFTGSHKACGAVDTARLVLKCNYKYIIQVKCLDV